MDDFAYGAQSKIFHSNSMSKSEVRIMWLGEVLAQLLGVSVDQAM